MSFGLKLASSWSPRLALAALVTLAALAVTNPVLAAGVAGEPLYAFGIPVDFILFALTLLGVALFHNQTFYVALAGLAAITAYKLGVLRFQGRLRRRWLDWPPAPRVGDARQLVPIADGFCAPGSTL